jgi:hypothetical protein
MLYITHKKIFTIHYSVTKISAKPYVCPLAYWQIYSICEGEAASVITLAKIRGVVNIYIATGENAGKSFDCWLCGNHCYQMAYF